MMNTGPTHAWVAEQESVSTPPSELIAKPAEELLPLMHERLRGLVDKLYWPKPRPVLLLGPTGVGKTVALAHIAQRISHRMCWTDGHSLCEAERRHPLGQGEAPLVEKAKRAMWLIVDDPDWARADFVLREVLEHRYRARRITLVASGLTFNAFKDRFGDAVIRRILESHSKDGGVIDLWEKQS